MVRVAVTQTTWNSDKSSMLDKHEQFVRDAAAQGAEAICFQELFYGPYFGITQDKKNYRVRRSRGRSDRPAVRRAREGAGHRHDPPDL